MESNNKETSLLGDPTNDRRLPATGAVGVKSATEASEEASCQASEGRTATDKSNITYNKCKISMRRQHRIGTWNVNGILKPGKLSNIEKEMEQCQLSIMGISETHLRGQGHFDTLLGNTLYYCGADDSSRNGVGILLPAHMNKFVLGYNPLSDRVITLKLNTKPFPLNIVQVYAPTSQSSEEALDDFYATVEEALNTIPSREIAIVLGDWNAKVGSTYEDDHLRNIVGRHGLGERNDRGQRMIEFCVDKKLSIMNTCFQHHQRRLYTWRSPGDRFRNQIDYIMIGTRWRSSISNVKTFPGADCGSDHTLLVAWFSMRLKAAKNISKSRPANLGPSELASFKETLEKQLKATPFLMQNANTSWEHLKCNITEAIAQTTGANTATIKANRCWVSDGTWDLIQQRKEIKTLGLQNTTVRESYQDLNRLIQSKCRHDKNTFVENICCDIEKHSHKLQTADLFKKVRLLSKQFKPKSWVIENAEGNLLHELGPITNRWREYCQDLYKNPLADITSQTCKDPRNIEQEPPILKVEILSALNRLKPKKAPGSDMIVAEILKSLGDMAVNMLHKICDLVWQSGEWPKDWSESIIIPLHKKGSTKKCENYRTLALISHASKVLLHIINSRLRHFLDWQIPREQAGFVKGRGTREQILNIRQIIEKCYEFDTPVIMCFIDYSKAFDCVNWASLWRVLTEFGVPQHLISLLSSLYSNNRGVVKIDKAFSDPFKFEKGVRQGCILSPILFNIYGEFIMRQACEGWEGGVTIGGVKLTNLRYADDTTLFAADEAEMVELIRRVERVSREFGLLINKSKTKVLIVDRTKKLETAGNLSLNIVSDFIYLGSSISSNGSCEKEIRRRIGMAKNATSQLEKIWNDRNITKRTKIKLMNTLIFPIFLYGAETWTVRTADRKRIDAFEMWCWRKMLRIPWTARRTNVSILEELKMSKRLSTICLARTLEYFGHIARRSPDSLERLTITGKVDGRRPRGRSPMRWTDQVRTTLDTQLYQAFYVAEDRKKWRDLIKEKVMRRGRDPQ